MGLLSREKFISPISQRYTVSGFDKKQLIVGIGNITERYMNNRHNLGFMVINQLAEKTKADWKIKKALKSALALTLLRRKR